MARSATMSYEDALDSRYLSNSISSLSQSRSTNSLIVRSYKSATQLYLTKRFKEALDTLEPVISPRSDPAGAIIDGDDSVTPDLGPSPIAQSSRGTRTKVWVFYLTLLHSIIELGQEDGKTEFGIARWRELVAKVHDGRIWDEVVRCGYGGNEGEVDADVVVNLATLLLGHMQNQRLNQEKLENYLSASDAGGANGHFSWPQDGISTPMSTTSSSPKSLATRLKILELYTLHVLPANEEWEYARSFIEMSDVLDEERKEAFLNALLELKEQKDGLSQREQELREQREREMEEQRCEEDARRAEEVRKEELQRKSAAEAERQRHAPPPTHPSGNTPTLTPTPTSASSSRQQSAMPSSRPSRNVKKPTPAPPPTFLQRASIALNNLQQMVLQAGRNMNFSSVTIFRLLLFMVAFLLLISRQDLRAKVRRAINNSLVKVKQTIGMGVKVSYI